MAIFYFDYFFLGIQNIEKDEKLSKSEVTSAVKKITKLRKKKADVEEKFLLGMDDLLDPLQMTILGMFKQKMLREMGGELRKRGDERRNKKKKMKKYLGVNHLFYNKIFLSILKKYLTVTSKYFLKI